MRLRADLERLQPAITGPSGPASAGPALRGGEQTAPPGPAPRPQARPAEAGSGAAMAAPGGAEEEDADALWAEARALLPAAEEGLSLELSGEVEDCVPPLLRRARRLLYGEAGRPCGAAAAALRRLSDVLRDYSWERLNAGPWREVSKAWRQVYAYGCLFGALAEVAAGRPLAPAVRLCDMGLLMGASVLDNVLARLVRVLQAHLPRGERRAAAQGSAKVPPGPGPEAARPPAPPARLPLPSPSPPPSPLPLPG